VPKLSGYLKVAEAAEIPGVFLESARTWGADGKIVMLYRHKQCVGEAGIEVDIARKCPHLSDYPHQQCAMDSIEWDSLPEFSDSRSEFL
jgi:hypothetical protein